MTALLSVGSFGGQFQFFVNLVEQILGFSSVALHVPLVGLLRSANLFPSLLREVLSGCEIGMLLAADIVHRLLGQGNAATNECCTQGYAQCELCFRHTRSSPFRRIRNYPLRCDPEQQSRRLSHREVEAEPAQSLDWDRKRKKQ